MGEVGEFDRLASISCYTLRGFFPKHDVQWEFKRPSRREPGIKKGVNRH